MRTKLGIDEETEKKLRVHIGNVPALKGIKEPVVPADYECLCKDPECKPKKFPEGYEQPMTWHTDEAFYIPMAREATQRPGHAPVAGGRGGGVMTAGARSNNGDCARVVATGTPAKGEADRAARS